MFADVLSRPLGFAAIIEPSSKSIPEILRAAHDKAGHMSVRYTLKNIENLFTWPTSNRKLLMLLQNLPQGHLSQTAYQRAIAKTLPTSFANRRSH